jgi:GTP cyclohydrolase II
MKQHARAGERADSADVQREAVDRAVAELRRGSAVVITGHAGSAILVRAAETVDFWPLPFFTELAAPVSVVVTGRRAAILGLSEPTHAAVQLNLRDRLTPERLRALIDPQGESSALPPDGVGAAVV